MWCRSPVQASLISATTSSKRSNAKVTEVSYLRTVHPVVVRLTAGGIDTAALGAASVVLHRNLTAQLHAIPLRRTFPRVCRVPPTIDRVTVFLRGPVCANGPNGCRQGGVGRDRRVN